MIKKIALLMSLFTTLSSQAVELDYKTECIGSYSLLLPNNLEVALYPTATYLQAKSRYPIYFADGKHASSSMFNYNRNNLMITALWENNDFSVPILKSFHDGYDKTKIKNPDNNFESILGQQNFGYYSDFNSMLFYILNKRVYHFYTNEYYQGIEKNFAFYKQNAQSIIAGFSPRELFELPTSAGKCIPYGFVAGNNPSTPLNLGVSFRLNEHPDIVITFTENTRSFTNSLKYSAKEEMEYFWRYNYDANNDDISAIKLLPPKKRDITMDGRNGVASFVEIKYKDNAPSDYGYYAAVDYYSRNEQSQQDHPWLQLSIIGKASESKGKKPLTKHEIYALAKKIEESIIRRETER